MLVSQKVFLKSQVKQLGGNMQKKLLLRFLRRRFEQMN
jgi:hypothetical protein